MARTGNKKPKAAAARAPYLEAVMANTVQALEAEVQARGTDFLKEKKAMEIEEIEVPVLAYYCRKKSLECARKVLELEPVAELKEALYYAIQGESLDCVRFVLDAHKARGDNPEAVMSSTWLGGLRLITDAAAKGLDILKEICEREGVGFGDLVLNNSVTRGQFTRITPIDAASSGDVVDYLCKRWKQDPNNGIPESECDKNRPLHGACYRTKFDLIEGLVLNGAHIQARSVNHPVVVGKPFHVLCANLKMSPGDLLKSLRFLVAHGADPAEPSIMERRTPLAVALKFKNKTAVNYLIVEARVPFESEQTAFAGDGGALGLLQAAKALRESGATQVDLPVGVTGAVVERFAEFDHLVREGSLVSSDCVYNPETFELSLSQPDEPPLDQYKAASEKVARCLLGEKLHSDASCTWYPFYIRKNEQQRASRRASALDKTRSRLLQTLGTPSRFDKAFKLVNAANKATVLNEHLGWGDEPQPMKTDLTMDSLTLEQAKNLDRPFRLTVLMDGLGANAFCARFDKMAAYPVFIGTYSDDDDVVYGCFSMRVET